jgi:transcriptional regulator GlxA family with amidase domain
MKLIAEASLQDARPGGAHKLDWLIVPGGIGWFKQQHNTTLKSFLQEWNQPDSGLQMCFSVCTGSGLLAAAGLLDGHSATSNKSLFDTIAGAYPAVKWIRQARWVQDGKFVTSSGVSAGTDMAVYVVKEVLGAAKAKASLKYNEYIANTDQHDDPYADPHYDPPV